MVIYSLSKKIIQLSARCGQTSKEGRRVDICRHFHIYTRSLAVVAAVTVTRGAENRFGICANEF